MYDYFVSYASEDRERIVRPLASLLTTIGLSVWYDQFELRLGDSLLGRIQEGIAASRYGIVVISPSFLQKKWPRAEIAGLFATEEVGSLRILPVWHGLSAREISKQVPILADRVGISSDEGLLNVVREILRATASEKLPRLRTLGLRDNLGAAGRLEFDRDGDDDDSLLEALTQEGREATELFST